MKQSFLSLLILLLMSSSSLAQVEPGSLDISDLPENEGANLCDDENNLPEDVLARYEMISALDPDEINDPFNAILDTNIDNDLSGFALPNSNSFGPKSFDCQEGNLFLDILNTSPTRARLSGACVTVNPGDVTVLLVDMDLTLVGQGPDANNQIVPSTLLGQDDATVNNWFFFRVDIEDDLDNSINLDEANAEVSFIPDYQDFLDNLSEAFINHDSLHALVISSRDENSFFQFGIDAHNRANAEDENKIGLYLPAKAQYFTRNVNNYDRLDDNSDLEALVGLRLSETVCAGRTLENENDGENNNDNAADEVDETNDTNDDNINENNNNGNNGSGNIPQGSGGCGCDLNQASASPLAILALFTLMAAMILRLQFLFKK